MTQPTPSDSDRTQAEEPDLLAVARSMGAGTMVERLGIEITEWEPERVVGTMPVAGNTQPYGLLHGGASVALAETLGSFGSAMHAGLDRVAVGIEINATHHRAARDGRVIGEATAISLGRTLCTWQVRITDEEGHLVCTSRITCMLRDAPPGAGRVPRA